MPATVGESLVTAGDVVSAAARAASEALDALGGQTPDLAFVFVSGAEGEVAEQALSIAAENIGARTSLGCTAHGVMGSGRAVEGRASVSVWAAVLPKVTLRAFHLEVIRTSESIAILGLPDRRDEDVVGVLLADPWSFPTDGFIGRSEESLRGLPLVGGLASGAPRAGQARLLINGKVVDRGAVGVVIGGDVEIQARVSQGCRPIGTPYTVTDSDGTKLLGLGGIPPVQRARDAVASLPEEERAMAVRGLHLGVAVREYTDEHHADDYLVRPLVAADEVSGALDVGEHVEVGTTVQFLLRDADAAHDDLGRVLDAMNEQVGLTGFAGALVFSCNGRGRSMFPDASHDVGEVRRALNVSPVSGFFASGEIGPVAGRNHIHGFTATVLAFGR